MDSEKSVYYQYDKHRKLLSNIQIECIKTLKTIYEKKIDHMMRLYEKEIISMKTYNTTLKRCINQLISSITDNDSDDGDAEDGLSLECRNVSCESFLNDYSFNFSDATTTNPINDASNTNKKVVDPLKIVEEVLRNDRNLNSLNLEQLMTLQDAIILSRKKYFANENADQSLFLNRCLDFSLLKQRIKKVENELSRTCLRLENCKSFEIVNPKMPMQQTQYELNEALMQFNKKLEETIKEKDILNNELKLKLSKFENVAELDSDSDSDSYGEVNVYTDEDDGDVDDDEEDAQINRRLRIRSANKSHRNNAEVVNCIINKDNTIQKHRFFLFNDHL